MKIRGLDAVEPLGTNGFVTTFRAYDQALGRGVTVEVLPPVTGNEEALVRFEQTLRALYAKPRHPAILPIHELGQLEDGRPYVITLRSTAASLGDRAREAPLPSARVAALGATLADALATAHERGVVHGDIRLDHVRMTEGEEPLLGSFGYDRLARTLRTARSDLVTSLTNASPEVLAGAEPDAAADVWALSCCLHQLLVGRSPFGLHGRPTLPEIVDCVLHQPLEDLRAVGVADDLATVLEAALQRDRSVRLSTAASLRRALRAVGRIHGQPRAEVATPADAHEVPPAPFQAPTPLPVSPSRDHDRESDRNRSHSAASIEDSPDEERVRRQIRLLLVVAAGLLAVLAVSVFSLLR